MARLKVGTARIAWRRLVLTMGSTAYVAAAAVRETGGRGVRTWLFVLAALGTAYVATRRKGGAATAATWGLAMVLASLAPARPAHGVEALGAVGGAAAALAAGWAILRAAAVPSLARSRPFAVRPVLAALLLAWAAAAAAHLMAIARPASAWPARAPLAGGGAALLSVAVLLLCGWAVIRRRRLELGVVPRISAAMGVLATTALLASGVGILRIEDGDRVGRLALAGAAAMVVWVALHADGVRVAQVSRRVLVLGFVGGGVAMVGAGAADGGPRDAGLVALLTAAATLLVGAVSRTLEAPLRPLRGEWLDAIEKARGALLETDPDEAVREALAALHAPVGPTGTSPELWSFSPLRVATVDAAGYLREREAVLPDGILDAAGAEPEATLRVEVLESLEVRRPDLRATCAWMQARGAYTVTVVARGGEPEGMLILPMGTRVEILSLEEARAIKRLADALAAICNQRGRHTRALQREQDLTRRAEQAEEDVEVLRHARDVAAGRHALAAARLARPATVGVYAAASRMALESIERRTHAGAPSVIVAPSGVDPVPYLARAHLEGPRRDAPFAVVDATSVREQDVARWSDPGSSPLALADGGTLVLLDAVALPPEVQRLVARALSEKRPPWERPEPLDVTLSVTTAVGVEHPAFTSRLEPMLATRLGDALGAPIVLPRLRERPEDLRGIVTDRLAREGVRVRGAAVGIEAAAYARLVEYPFPGEDPELTAIVQRLVALAPGDVVRAQDVDAVLRERTAGLERDRPERMAPERPAASSRKSTKPRAV